MAWFSYKPYVSVAQKRTNALKEIAKLRTKGKMTSPVVLDSKKITSTFWGKSWCQNLESYSDYASRLPRGRSYVRNGSVLDLQIAAGHITALVSGSELYKISIKIRPLQKSLWTDIQKSCAGKIASVIELLKGGISDHVMGVVTNQATGLFPSPAEIELDCSCPDWAGMCKHVAAVLYGVGARLDQKPELLFALRQVDHLDLISSAGDISLLTQTHAGAKTISANDLADVFGIELSTNSPVPPGTVKPAPATAPKRIAKRSPKQTVAAAPKPKAKQAQRQPVRLGTKAPAKQKTPAKTTMGAKAKATKRRTAKYRK